MKQSIKEVMTTNPRTLDATATIREAARMMRDGDIGDVLVMRGDEVSGIVTDRDIVVRALAEGRDGQSSVGDIATADIVTVTPNDSVEKAVRIMRERAIRRLPVIDDGKPIGILSLGDLAMERDPESALADISAAPPTA